jgi:hypothetical protein
MNKDTFQTSDTVLAATLLSLAYQAIDYTSLDGRTVIYFNNTPKLQKDLNKYWTRKLLVEPTTFQLNYKRIKTVIDSQNNDKSSE